MAAGKYSPPPIVAEAIKRWDAAKSHHDVFVKKYERRERAYRGVLTAASDAAKWRHKQHPPLLFPMIETIVSNTVEMGLRFEVHPSPHLTNIPLDQALEMLDKADVVGDLLRHEHRIDEMDFKQRPLFLTAAIGGIGVGKSYWNYAEGAVYSQKVIDREVHDHEGNLLGTVPVLTEVEEQGVLRDHSTFEVVDPRDFVVHESAKALQPWEPGGAQHLFHRCWYSFEQLKTLERGGFVQNVDLLKESLDFTDEYNDREKQVWERSRTKDLIEVLEYWCFEDGRVYRALIGNRMVLLRDREASPFRHGGYPFIISSSMPTPFSTIGTSEIELVEALQEIIWELTNQSLDNVELINNAIYLIRSDVDDPDAFEYYPGARWPVDGDPKSAVEALQPPYQIANVAMEWNALLRGDLQNVTSAAPFAGGTQTANIDQKTATGVSIIMNAAQQRLVAKKYQAQQGLRQEAEMRIKNCQQFISGQRLVHVLGEDGARTYRTIEPIEIQGLFVAELEPMGESMMRQERRAESTQLAQVLLQAAPLAAAAGVPVNVREILTWMLKKGWDVYDADRFFSVQPESAGAIGAPAGPGAPGLGIEPPGSGPPANPLANLGTTSSTAVDASKPSATGGLSMSPALMMQRALAMRGGVKNA